MEENRAFMEMLKAAVLPLEHLNPEQIALKAGGIWDESVGILTIRTLGKNAKLRLPKFESDSLLEPWQTLILLHYLANADGTPVSGKLVTFGSMRDGLIRGTKYDASSEKQLSAFIGQLTPETLRKACGRLGGTEVQDKCDLCVTFPLFPHFPVTMKVWFADEEFPASGKLFVDQNADHYLSVEDAVTVGDIIISGLQQEIQ